MTTYILCRTCRTIFTATHAQYQQFDGVTQILNDHMLEYHLDILGTEAADDVQFKVLDCSDYVWESMMRGVFA